MANKDLLNRQRQALEAFLQTEDKRAETEQVLEETRATDLSQMDGSFQSAKDTADSLLEESRRYREEAHSKLVSIKSQHYLTDLPEFVPEDSMHSLDALEELGKQALIVKTSSDAIVSSVKSLKLNRVIRLARRRTILAVVAISVIVAVIFGVIYFWRKLLPQQEAGTQQQEMVAQVEGQVMASSEGPTATPIPRPPTNTPTVTRKPTSTPTRAKTPTPTKTPTVARKPTSSPTPSLPLSYKYHPVPINSIANDDLGAYGEPPTGDSLLGGVPFHVSVSFGTQGDILRDRPTSAILKIDPPIPHPAKIFLLMNSGATYKHFEGLQLGTVDLRFSDGSLHTTQLIVGKNIREWQFTAPGVVSTISSSDVQEVYRVKRAGEDFAVLDMLTITIPEQQRSSDLIEIMFTDTSQDTTGSLDPGFFVAGVTVQQ